MNQDPDDLPALESLIPWKGSKQRTRIRADQMLTTLRNIAKSLRRQRSRRFYTVREVAARFECSLGTVTGVFQRLEHEGILARIRGSRTMLVGRKLHPRTPARAVVGIISKMYSLIVNPDTRALDRNLIEHLSQHGYVADLIFHFADHNEPELVEHLMQHRVDIAIVQMPGPKIRQNILALRDRGIRTIVIQDMLMPASLPAVIYQLNWIDGYERLADRWHQDGIRRAIMPMRPEEKLARSTAALQNVFEARGIKAELCTMEFSEIFRAARRSRTAVAMLDRFGAARTWNQHPLEAARLLRQARVGFFRGPIYVPYLCHQDVTADVLVHSSSEIAKKVASDISGNSEKGDGVRHVFFPELMEKDTFADPETSM